MALAPKPTYYKKSQGKIYYTLAYLLQYHKQLYNLKYIQKYKKVKYNNWGYHFFRTFYVTQTSGASSGAEESMILQA